MFGDKLKDMSQAGYVEYGYGQVEPNHLSARRTGQIYAQLPANKDIQVLENGQFVKYDYLAGEVNFTGEGEWMLVFNEIKLYREEQVDCEFAMVKSNYVARVYSPSNGEETVVGKSRHYNGDQNFDGVNSEKVTVPAGARDDWSYTEDPFNVMSKMAPKMMPDGTVMVPRVLKTNVGDIYTTNTVDAGVKLGDILAPRATDGILAVDNTQAMKWQVVKEYTMPDGQKGVKIIRIA